MPYTEVEDLEVYKLAFELAVQIHELTKSWPKDELFGGLGSQIRRSSKSICGNLAEGLGKLMSSADEIKFLSIAKGSAAETRTWLTFSARLNYIDNTRVDLLRADYLRVIEMLSGLIRKRLG